MSVDFAEVEAMQAGEWDAAGDLLAAEARALEAAGADCLVLCTNTMHKVVPAIEAATSVPVIHIVDVAADAVRAAGLTRFALLGTRFTMQEPFVRERLSARGVEAEVPAGRATRRAVRRTVRLGPQPCAGQSEW